MTREREPDMRILIAEDDPIPRRVLEVFLVKRGYSVTAATNGEDALRILLGDNAPRLAVLDWMTPRMEGTQVCQKVREHADRPYVYILLLTARNQKEDLVEGLRSGADDYLTKPFDSRELEARLMVGQRNLGLQDNLVAAWKELQFRATHDALTGLPNRGSVLDVLQREHSRHVREGGSIGVVMVDIDHFKNINDTYGHFCGDSVLRESANRMVASVRPYDTVGRYGGEEFLIVLPGSDALGALGVAERIRKVIESHPVSTQAGEVGLTASLGIAVSDDRNPLDLETLLRAADAALYRAKDQGRNHCEVAPPFKAVTAESSVTGPAQIESGSP